MMANEPRPAGGRATAAGMTFQAGVGVWFAAHLATSSPLGARFGLSAAALPQRLQFETAQFLDDIQMDLSDGSLILVQCKTRPALSAAVGGPLADTIAQLASLLLVNRSRGTDLDPKRTAAVLAVAADASGSLNDLEAACRYFDFGATWADAIGRVSSKQAAALQILADAAREAWKAYSASAPTEGDLASLARLLRVVRFDVEHGGADQREAARLIGSKLLANEGAGTAGLAFLEQVVDRMTRAGAPADRFGLIQQLRAAGFVDTRSPCFDDDLNRLIAKTRSELQRLTRHTRLATSSQAPIPRQCMPALSDAIKAGSLLVIGEPGAGKTGVLVSQVERLAQGTAPLVLLSVDSLSSVSDRDVLRKELQLEHDLLDVLSAWPGIERGILVIDALDASRGGPAEQVFANLIEEGLRRIGERWSIVASIRTFDLKNGTRFRTIMAGEPPSLSYLDPDLGNVRHFLVPRLSLYETDELARTDPQLSCLFTSAPPLLQDLLRNVFNLSLAAQLISGGTSAQSIATVTTQSDLIWRYEDARLHNDQLRNAVGDTLKVMIEKRRITVLRSRIGNDAVSDVVRSGVLALAGERIAFSHHVLFDHAASRYYLEWDDMDALALQVSMDPAIGLLLGPALRFAIEKVWREDGPGHVETWRLIAKLCATNNIDPVVTSVALRSAAEGVAGVQDVAGLIELLRVNAAPRELATTLDRLARFVGIRTAEPNGLSACIAKAWAAVARQCVDNLQAEYSDGARFLLMTLAEKGDFSNSTFAKTFGEAARNLLAFAWSKEPDLQGLANQAIRFVTASYASDVTASRALLARTLEDPRFEQHAHEETPWLAEGVAIIAPIDPAFVFQIYRTIFGRSITENAQSWLGGRPSRILALSSNRKQDYEHGRWHLKEVFPTVMSASPHWGTKTASAVVIGTAMRERRGRKYNPVLIKLSGGREMAVIVDYQTLSDWRAERHPDYHDEVLQALVNFLRECSVPEFRAIVETALEDTSASSVWGRILSVGAERSDAVGDILWPIGSAPRLIELSDVGRDAIIFLATVYPSLPDLNRLAFEAALVEWLHEDPEAEERRVSLAARILSTVPEEALATSAMRSLKQQLRDGGRLVGNRPSVKLEFDWSESDDISDELLRDGGSDLSQGPNKAVRDPTRELENTLREVGSGCDEAQVSKLWAAVLNAQVVLQEPANATAHAEVLRASWGAVGGALDKIVEVDAYDPGLLGHPSLKEITALVDRLAASPYPEQIIDQTNEGVPAWGNWDVRVYAASALVNMCRRFGGEDPSLIERLDALAFDPVPAVRMQIAQALNVLWDLDREKMWELASRVSREEQHLGVLSFFVDGPLKRLSDPEPERAEAIASELIGRIPRPADKKSERAREPAAEAISGLAARLWIARNRPAALSWIIGWTADLVSNENYLWSLLFNIRMGLFRAYMSPGDQKAAGIQERSKDVVDRVVQAASRMMSQSLAETEREEVAPNVRSRAETAYNVAARLLDHAMSQLYFGSGVYRRRQIDGEEDKPGLADGNSKRAFLREYSGILNVIGQSGTARTLHHLLELYGYLADAAPDPVFDRLSELLVGPASREGYQFESLGIDAVVRLVRRYLADHREVFEDRDRRARLVGVLELFSRAGSPDALKLLYELPDLLR